MPDVSPKTDVLIITVTKVESQMVMKVFHETTGKIPVPIHIDGRIYHNLGEINGARIFMALSEMGTGGPGASQQAVQKGIDALHPTNVIMVGIAFGVNDQKQAIGDILVSTKLWLYDLQRIGTYRIIPRGAKPDASANLINYFRSADLYWSDATVQFGLILTGEKLIDDVDYRDQLRQLEPEAIGGEMEGSGLYVACQEAHVNWILIKAICDWADGNKSLDKDSRQQLAAKNASLFLLHALQKTPIVIIKNRKTTRQLVITIAAIIVFSGIVGIFILSYLSSTTNKGANTSISTSPTSLANTPIPTIVELNSATPPLFSQTTSPLVEATNTPSPTIIESTPSSSTPSNKAINFVVSLEKILQGKQEREVWGVTFSTDNKTFANTSYDGKIRRWNTTSGKLLDTFSNEKINFLGIRVENNSAAIGIAYNPDGTIIASTHQDGSVKLWQVADGALIYDLEGHTSAAWSVSWSYDGNLLASSGADGTVRLWNTTTGEELKVIRASTSVATNVAFSPDGTSVAGLVGNKLYIWDTSNGNKNQELDINTEGAFGLSWSSDGVHIINGGNDDKIRLWNANNGELIHTFEIQSPTTDVAFSPDGQIIAAGGSAKKIWFFSAKTFEILYIAEGSPEVITSIDWSSDGQYVVNSCQDGTIMLWKVTR